MLFAIDEPSCDPAAGRPGNVSTALGRTAKAIHLLTISIDNGYFLTQPR